MISKFAVLVFLLAAMSVTAGCGSASVKTRPAPPPIDEDLAALAPDGFNQVLWLNLSVFKNSPLWTTATTFAKEEILAQIQTATGIDVLTQVNEILIIGGIANTQKEFLALIKGTFDANAAVSNGNTEKSPDSIIPLNIVKVETPPLVITALTGRTIAVGTQKIVEQSVALTKGVGRSLRQNPNFKDFNLAPDSAAALRLKRDVTSSSHTLSNDLPLPKFKWTDSITDIDTTLTISEGFTIAINANLGTPNTASAARKDLEHAINDIMENPFVMMLGVRWLFEKITFDNKDSKLNVTMSLDAADMDKVLELTARLKKIRDMLKPVPPQKDNQKEETKPEEIKQ